MEGRSYLDVYTFVFKQCPCGETGSDISSATVEWNMSHNDFKY